MEDYPRNLGEFERRLATEAAGRASLAALRWPDGFRCPKCGGSKAWRHGPRGLLECASCGRQTSVTAGTIFQDTRPPLTMWFRAMWGVTAPKPGLRALGLPQVLGLGSYKTAWTWRHKLRRAMVRPGRDRLHGHVEVDETLWGAKEPGLRGRDYGHKALVAVAVEQLGRRGLGRIRLQRIADASAQSLPAFVEEAVEPGSVLHTDGWISDDRLEKRGYGQRSRQSRSARRHARLIAHNHKG